jgi:type I restriction enzyme M protein
VQLLVEMVEPYEGRVYDPCCGSGGMFVQSANFVTAHGGSVNDISVYGQESNPTTWKLAKMNLALKGIEADLGDQWADTFANPKHPDLKADFASRTRLTTSTRGTASRTTRAGSTASHRQGNSNYGWMQHILHHLAPGGTPGVVMANGTLTTEQSGEHDIRRKMLEDDVVDCIVTLPTQLFYTTQIPVCLWFFSRARTGAKGQRKRTGEVLFINAKHVGEMVSRTNRELTDDDIASIAGVYHAWRGTSDDSLRGRGRLLPLRSARRDLGTRRRAHPWPLRRHGRRRGRRRTVRREDGPPRRRARRALREGRGTLRLWATGCRSCRLTRGAHPPQPQGGRLWVSANER